MTDRGFVNNVRFSLANAERLPFPDSSFDCVTIGFGLRNVTDKAAALRAMQRGTPAFIALSGQKQPGASYALTLAGTGTAVDPYVISSDVRLDPTPPDGGTNLIRLGPGS